MSSQFKPVLGGVGDADRFAGLWGSWLGEIGTVYASVIMCQCLSRAEPIRLFQL